MNRGVIPYDTGTPGYQGSDAVTRNQRIASRIRKLLARFPGLELVYLFGSQTESRAGPLSDYDFGVVVEDNQAPLDIRAQLAHELALALGTNRIDIVILNWAPIELAYTVIAQGILVYQRDEATRVEYEAEVMSRYGDYLPVLRAQIEAIRRGGERETRVQRYREALRRTERKIGQIRAAKGERPR